MAGNGTYDRDLLAEAPRVEKAEARKGYDVGILGHQDSAATSGPHSNPDHDAPLPSAPAEPNPNKTADEAPYRKPKSFWRTTWGKVTVAAIIIVILGAAIGGGVGGGLSHKGGSKSSAATNGSGSDGSGNSSGSDTNQGTSPGTTDSVQQQAATPVATSTSNRRMLGVVKEA